MLDLHDVNAFYGDSHILHGVSLSVGEGEVVCLLGRNGAGKTTTILTVMGYLRPRPGRIVFRGRDIAALPPYAVARLGIGFVPQERGIFPSLTVRENLTVFARSAASGPWTLDRVFAMFPEPPGARRAISVFSLSGGEQQMLSIARALMLNPRLLLLDEPSEGLAPMIVQTIIEAMMSLKSAGLAILLVEQNLARRARGRRPPSRHQQGANLLHRQFGRARGQRVCAAQLPERMSRERGGFIPRAVQLYRLGRVLVAIRRQRALRS